MGTVGVGDASAVAHAGVGRVDDEVGDRAGACAAIGGETGRRAVLKRLFVVADDTAKDVLGLGAAGSSITYIKGADLMTARKT